MDEYSQAWQCAVAKVDADDDTKEKGRQLFTHWTKARTAQEEKQALQETRKRTADYILRGLHLILHEFGWPGDRPYMEWVREELATKGKIFKAFKEEEAKVFGLQAEVETLKAALGDERAKPKRQRKKAAKRRTRAGGAK